LLAFASTKTFHKGWQIQSKMKKQAKDRAALEAGLNGTSLQASPVPSHTSPAGGAQLLQDEAPAALVPAGEEARELEPVKMRIPWKVVGFMLAFNIAFFIDYALMSSDVTGTKRCSWLYWVALIGLYPFVFGALGFGHKSMQALAKFHEDRGDEPVEGDPVVSLKLVIVFSAVALIIGLVAGLLGLGGGEFTVPLMLEFGLLPRVAASTSGFLMVFTTSSNVVHYLVAGTIEPFFGYGVACFILAGIGAGVGVVLRDSEWMRERSYLLVYLIATILGSSGFLLVARGGLSHIDFDFGSFCAS